MFFRACWLLGFSSNVQKPDLPDRTDAMNMGSVEHSRDHIPAKARVIINVALLSSKAAKAAGCLKSSHQRALFTKS